MCGAHFSQNRLNARRCSLVSAVPITEKLLLNAGGWQAMKPARELLKSGRVSEAKYEPPLLSGYVREGAKNYRSGLRIKSAIDVENLCSCWESRSAGKICAHSVAVGLGYLKPPAAVVAAPNEPTMPEAPAGPRFVAADSADAALTTLHVILPPNFAGAWQKGQIMIVVEAEVSRNRTLVSALPKKNTFAVDGADLVLIEGLRTVPAIFEGGMAILSRDAFLRLLLALQNHPRITFGKATRATISSAALRPELLVESRGEGGIAVKCNFPRKIDHEQEHELATASPSDGGHEQEKSADPLERDRCVAAAEQRVRSLRRSVAGRLDAPDRAAVAARWRTGVALPRIRSAAAARCIRCARRRRRSPSRNRNGAASL